MTKYDQIINSPDILASLRQEKDAIRKKLRKSSNRMSGTTHQIFAPVPRAKTKAQGVSQFISNGIAIWEGVRIGMGLISAVRNFFGGKRRWR